jgi:hypothetical protein
MLETILTEIIAGKRATPHYQSHGARLDYDDKTQQLTITRLNKSPDDREMSIFKAYIKRVGYRVTSSTPAEIEPGVNSWVGRTLQLVALVPEMPAAKQESLF